MAPRFAAGHLPPPRPAPAAPTGPPAGLGSHRGEPPSV